MKSIKIHGKDYVEVSERVREFRENKAFDDWSIETEVLFYTVDDVVIKATVYNPLGRAQSTGIAQETKGSSNINRTSHVENCETSAVGRALGFLGIGIEGAICSANEVQQAISRQNLPDIDFKAEEEVGGYVIPFGKYRGKNLSEIGKPVLASYWKWIQSQSKFDRKDQKNILFYNAIEEFLNR